jgi:hypothetical protein
VAVGALYSHLLALYSLGVAAVIISNPLWVVNTRLKLQGMHLPHLINSRARDGSEHNNDLQMHNGIIGQ